MDNKKVEIEEKDRTVTILLYGGKIRTLYPDMLNRVNWREEKILFGFLGNLNNLISYSQIHDEFWKSVSTPHIVSVYVLRLKKWLVKNIFHYFHA